MDKEEKRKLANERRLKSVQQWKKNRKQHGFQSEANSEPSPATKNKRTYYGSDQEEEVLNGINDSNAQPQYEEDSSQCSVDSNSELQENFDVDDRFVTLGDEEDKNGKCGIKNMDNSKKVKRNENSDDIGDFKKTEKAKNMHILETVLGRTVKERYSTTGGKRKSKIMRFDPEDENSSRLLKNDDKSTDASTTAQKNNAATVENNIQVPFFTERFVNIDSNLKEILSSSSKSFNFSEKFETSELLEDFQDAFLSQQKTDDHSSGVTDTSQKNDSLNQYERNQFVERRHYSFFIPEGHPYLKQGVDFFLTTKSTDTKIKEWDLKKETAMILFKNKVKTTKRRKEHEVKPGHKIIQRSKK